jgi:hypothetical protein
MVHRLRRGALTRVFTGIGFAVLHRRDRQSPVPADAGRWVDLPFDAQRLPTGAEGRTPRRMAGD